MEQEKIEVKSHKHSYGKYLLIFAFLSVIFSSVEQSIKLHSLSVFSAFFITFVGIILSTSVTYFLVLWIADLIRRRGGIDRLENKKVRMVINIVFIVMFLGIINSVLMVVKKSPSAEFNFEQTSFTNELFEKNKNFSDENGNVDIATQSLLDIFNNQEQSKIHGALQNLLSTTQALQPKIDELKNFTQQNATIFSDEKEIATLYSKAIDDRDRYNKKLIELAKFGLKIDWNNPDEAQVNKWAELADELSITEKEVQTTQTELQAAFQNSN